MSKAQWKYYRDDCISTLRAIADFLEDQKYDYDQRDLERLLTKVVENHEVYLDKKYMKSKKIQNNNKAIDFYS